MQKKPPATETAATESFARAWNRMDVGLFDVAVASNVSLYLFSGKRVHHSANFLYAYMMLMMERIRAEAQENPACKVRAQTGTVSRRAVERPCTILSSARYLDSIVVFDIFVGKVRRVMVRTDPRLDTKALHVFPI
jgi:hypothetical protein